jgi:hypothetical protein
MNVTIDYAHVHILKRRVRTAPSARREHYGPVGFEEEIHLAALWNGDDQVPPKGTEKDPILWSIWMMKSGMVFCVVRNLGSKNATAFETRSLAEAKREYRKLVKEFPRSKEIDYGFPWGQDHE